MLYDVIKTATNNKKKTKQSKKMEETIFLVNIDEADTLSNDQFYIWLHFSARNIIIL